jgi:hypothetical protein
MIDMSRFAGDGVGARPRPIKSMQVVHMTDYATIAINEVDPDYSAIVQITCMAAESGAGASFVDGTHIQGGGDMTLLVIEFDPAAVKRVIDLSANAQFGEGTSGGTITVNIPSPEINLAKTFFSTSLNSNSREEQDEWRSIQRKISNITTSSFDVTYQTRGYYYTNNFLFQMQVRLIELL